MIPALNPALRRAQGASSVMMVYLVTMWISCHRKRTVSLKQVPYGKNHVSLLTFVPLVPRTFQGHSRGLRKAYWVSLDRTLIKDSEPATRPCPGILVTGLWGKFAFCLWSPSSFVKKNRPNTEPRNTWRKPIVSSNACESSSVYLDWTWTKLWNCNYAI